ncbi:zinc-ribbon domain-containing protein [Anaeromyxobacter oryzisoli]|uniref:zinc-ribbon domain-containing protein n=1 Tax=Anaeromyxobacter oryzisoli TaxID=2925408 RepID=UPI001F57FC32|nr:zinc-ribbon domain-containing protein [Anaeromyxobacter sp. SG63]
MKFSCARCGKRYATAEQPVPGRVYKLKCKACGHVIVVKGEPATAPGAGAAQWTPPRLPADGPAPAAPSAPVGPTTELPLRRAQADQRVDPAAGSTGAVQASPVAAPQEVTSPSADARYVDIFAESPEARSGAPAADPFAPREPPPPAPVEPEPDPFLAAARSSLPETFGSASADPFAPMRAELEAAATGEAAKPTEASPPLPTPKVPDIPRPPTQKQGGPLLLIGGGVLVLVAIFGVAVASRGVKGPPAARAAAAPPPQIATPEPVPPPPPALPESAAAKPVAAPEPEPDPESKAEPKPEPNPEPNLARPAHVERQVERRPEPQPRKVAAAAPEPPRRQSQVYLPQASPGLSQEQIQRVLASTRKAFDGCITSARKGSSVPLDGRKVSLHLNIQPNGTVTYPTLDDVSLNATSLGSCLKSAARLMVFPKFKGDPMQLEVPLTLPR